MSTNVQDTKATNTLAQTFNIVFGGTPVEGNFLVAVLWHDETSTDIEDITSTGWVRMGTTVGSLGGVDYRISVWAKFAGSSESTTVAVDLGEVNRRAHGYAVELSGVSLDALPAADSATVEVKVQDSTGTSNQLDAAIQIAAGQLGISVVGLNGTSATPPTWSADPPTFVDNWSNNFRGSAVGVVDPSVSVQPTATWGSGRANIQAVVVFGEAIVPVTVKARSSFQLIQV